MLKITIGKNGLLNKLSKIKCAVGNAIKFYVKNNKLIAYVSNQIITAKISIADVEESDFSKVIDANIYNVIKYCPDNEVTLNFEDTRVSIASGKYKCYLNYIEDKILKVDFSIISKLSDLKIQQISETIKFASISAGSERPYLQGINIVIKDGKLILRSSDSFRASVIKLETEIKEEVNVILIPNALEKIINSINVLDSIIKVNKAYCYISDGEVEFLMRNIDGDYPDLDKFIPISFKHSIDVPRKEIVQTIERCSVIVHDYIELAFNSKEVRLHRKNDIGEIDESIDVESDIENMNIALSLQFLKDAINAYNCDFVRFMINGPYSQILIIDPKNDNSLQMILPIRIH